MAVAGLYRRELPSPPSIEFASPEGKKLFAEALGNGTMEGFFKLISYYQTQSEPAYCGLATLAVVLNALAIDPGRKWKGPWRWFDDSMLDCCEPLAKIKAEGITFGKVACLAHCNGAEYYFCFVDLSTILSSKNREALDYAEVAYARVVPRRVANHHQLTAVPVVIDAVWLIAEDFCGIAGGGSAASRPPKGRTKQRPAESPPPSTLELLDVLLHNLLL
ncbi:hypothetical protein ACLB2K_019747 [Fragaria x ananassa]